MEDEKIVPNVGKKQENVVSKAFNSQAYFNYL